VPAELAARARFNSGFSCFGPLALGDEDWKALSCRRGLDDSSEHVSDGAVIVSVANE
jgi:hypothetical protein